MTLQILSTDLPPSPSTGYPSSPQSRLWLRPFADSRLLQGCVLASLLCYGVFLLNCDQNLFNVALIFASSLAFQFMASRAFGVQFDPRSILITSLSLSILLRAAHPGYLVLATAIAVWGKFLIRVNDKHVFNPANLAIASLAFLTGECWVCPGQWGTGAIFAAYAACAGTIVVNSATRLDISAAFLFFYGGEILLRALYLNDPLAIPLHQLSSGALLIFTFFMISDPKTTPNTRAGRIAFALMVAIVAYLFRFRLYEPNALIYALILCSPVVPIIDRILPGERFQWRAPQPTRTVTV